MILNARWYGYVAICLVALLLVAGCARTKSQPPMSTSAATAAGDESDADIESQHSDVDQHVDGRESVEEADYLPELPAVSAVPLQAGEKLRVVATTGIVADVVANVGGDRIELTALIPVGADPHSFTATPADLRSLNDAHVIFVNGLSLEETLTPILENLDAPVPQVSVNSGIEPLYLEGDGHENGSSEEHNGDMHGGADPHTWFSVPNVRKWTDNAAIVLSSLDPSNAEVYDSQAASYEQELADLDGEIRKLVAELPQDQRKIVTDHVALGYFADEYGFEIVGSVLPALSTLAAASAQDLVALQTQIAAQGIPALFVSTTVNPQTASQLANDLGIPIVKLYIGSLSDADGPARTYIDLMRYDTSQIVEALRQRSLP